MLILVVIIKSAHGTSFLSAARWLVYFDYPESPAPIPFHSKTLAGGRVGPLTEVEGLNSAHGWLLGNEQLLPLAQHDRDMQMDSWI